MTSDITRNDSNPIQPAYGPTTKVEIRVDAILSTGSAFGSVVDTGEAVFIPSTIAIIAKVEVGDIRKATIASNRRHMVDPSAPRWFTTYIAPPPDHAVEACVGDEEADDGAPIASSRRIFERRSAGRSVADGMTREQIVEMMEQEIDRLTVFSMLDMVEAICRRRFYGGFAHIKSDPLGNRVASVVRRELDLRHWRGDIARWELRRSADQQRASRVLYTARPEMVRFVAVDD